MIRLIYFLSLVWVSAGLALSAAYAAQKEGGGAFVTPTPKKTLKSVPSQLSNYDGSYKIVATRNGNYTTLICLSSYQMTLVLKNGRSSHQLPFFELLHGRASGNKVIISSKVNKVGGRWRGILTLPSRTGVTTSGYLKWGGDGLKCEFTLVAHRN